MGPNLTLDSLLVGPNWLQLVLCGEYAVGLGIEPKGRVFIMRLIHVTSNPYLNSSFFKIRQSNYASAMVQELDKSCGYLDPLLLSLVIFFRHLIKILYFFVLC